MARILIADDKEKNLKLLKAILEKNGFETIEAENGEKAVGLAKEKQPDLILMDVRMPVLDGIAAAKILKSDPKTGRIPIVAVTASAMKGDREKILKEAGFETYISKPIEIIPFLELVKKIMGLGTKGER